MENTDYEVAETLKPETVNEGVNSAVHDNTNGYYKRSEVIRRNLKSEKPKLGVRVAVGGGKDEVEAEGSVKDDVS